MTQWGLDTLFNPGKRHMDEEKRRLQSTRQQIGDASGGKRIDLESGKVTIRRPSPTDEETDSADEGAAAPIADANQPGETSSGADLEVMAAPAEGSPAEADRL